MDDDDTQYLLDATFRDGSRVRKVLTLEQIRDYFTTPLSRGEVVTIEVL